MAEVVGVEAPSDGSSRGGAGRDGGGPSSDDPPAAAGGGGGLWGRLALAAAVEQGFGERGGEEAGSTSRRHE